MKILGIDTSTKFLCIGLSDGVGIYEYRLDLGRGHDIYLIEHIDRILKALKMKIKDIDYLAVGLGPGSFTGLRIGLSTVKGLSLVLKKKIVGISTLELIAYNALDLEDVSYICPIIDAKRKLLYTSVYQKDNFSLKQIRPLSLIGIEELIKIVPKGTTFLGDGLNLYRDNIMYNVKNSRALDQDYFWPKATNLIRLAIKYINRKKFTPLDKIKPLYLYPKECQINIKNIKKI